MVQNCHMCWNHTQKNNLETYRFPPFPLSTYFPSRTHKAETLTPNWGGFAGMFLKMTTATTQGSKNINSKEQDRNCMEALYSVYIYI